MYISPLASVAYSQATLGSATGSGVDYSVGATIGYSWVIGRHFNIRAGGGVQYMSIRAEAEGDGMTATAGYSGLQQCPAGAGPQHGIRLLRLIGEGSRRK